MNNTLTVSLALALAITLSCLSGCMSDGSDTIVLPVPSSGKVSSNIIPDAVRSQIEGSMPIHSGTNPPDIAGSAGTSFGQYRASTLTLVKSSISGDPLGKVYADLYLAFIKGSNGNISYREKQGNSESGSDNVTVEIVGSGNDFTAYFIKTGVSDGISTEQSTIISGTLASNGIRDFSYAFIMLKKGSDPDNKLVPVNTYRVFKDGDDGLAERYSWR